MADRYRRARLAIAAIALIASGCAVITPTPPSASPTSGAASPTSGAASPIPPTLVPTASRPATTAPSPTSSAVAPDLAGRLVCGGGTGISFSADVLDEPAAAELAPTVQAQALHAFVMTPDAAQEGYPDRGWRLVSSDPARVAYVAPGRDGWYFVSVEDVPDLGGWQAWEHGACDLQVEPPEGIGFATWELDPANPPQPDATSLTVLGTERACSSDRPMTGRLLAPIVLYAPEAVTIALLVRERPGGQDCPGNRPERVVVVLSEPLGNRELFDGSSYPAQRRG